MISTRRRARAAIAAHAAWRSVGDGHRVRLVDHHQVPHLRLQRSSDVGALEEVERSQVDARRGPGQDVGRQIGDAAAQPGRVGGRAGNRKAPRQFVDPLPAQARRDGDQDPAAGLAAKQVGDDPAGLDGLAEPDFVGEQDAARATRDGHGRRELIGQHAPVHAGAPSGSRARSPAPAPRPAPRHQRFSRTHRSRGRSPAATGRSNGHSSTPPPPGAAIKEVELAAVVVRDDRVEPPRRAAHADRRPDRDTGWQRLRPRHAALFAGIAIVDRIYWHFRARRIAPRCEGQLACRSDHVVTLRRPTAYAPARRPQRALSPQRTIGTLRDRRAWWSSCAS